MTLTRDDPRCQAVEQKLRETRAEMLRRGVQPLVKAEGERAELRPAWARINPMGVAEKPATVTPIRRGKR